MKKRTRFKSHREVHSHTHPSKPFISIKALSWFVAFVFLIIYFPILSAKDALWDGTIISYAWHSKDKLIFSTWFDESGWPLVRWLYEIIYEFCLTLGLNFQFTNNFIIAALVGLSGYEIYRLATGTYKFDNHSALLGVLFFFLIPVSTLYVASLAFIQLALFIYLCLFGTRLYLEGAKVPLAILLIALSFQHNSNPCLLFALIVLSYIFGDRKHLKKDALILFLLACWYLIFKVSFPPYGLYKGYNEISLGNIFNSKLYVHYLDFFSTAYPTLLVVSALLMFKARHTVKPILVFWFLAMISQFPYIVVGKTFQIRQFVDIGSWNYRFTINSSVIIALIFIFLLSVIKKSNFSILWKRALNFSLGLALLLNAVYTAYGYKQRATDFVYQDSIIKAFGQNKDAFKVGYVAIDNVNYFYYP